MSGDSQIEEQLRNIIGQYKDSFITKEYREENNDHDPLMDIFGITPDLKRENRQYWGRELGKCWEKLICKVFEIRCEDYQSALKIGSDEPCDCIIGADAIDAKYRIGSGDSGFSKKFRGYGKNLIELKYNPVLLILREDNLDSAISTCRKAGWNVLIGAQTFEYIFEKTNFDLLGWLTTLKRAKDFKIER
jgi:hypothetical protein